MGSSATVTSGVGGAELCAAAEDTGRVGVPFAESCPHLCSSITVL